MTGQTSKQDVWDVNSKLKKLTVNDLTRKAIGDPGSTWADDVIAAAREVKATLAKYHKATNGATPATAKPATRKPAAKSGVKVTK
jgi:hypothetical protein